MSDSSWLEEESLLAGGRKLLVRNSSWLEKLEAGVHRIPRDLAHTFVQKKNPELT